MESRPHKQEKKTHLSFCFKESEGGFRTQSVMDSLGVYERIVLAMFEDGEVNAGQLYVLYVITQTYCAEYKDQACDIWTAYNRVVEGLRCVPSSTNQQSGNLTNQKSPFPAD